MFVGMKGFAMKRSIGLVLISILTVLYANGQHMTELRDVPVTGSDGSATMLRLAEDRPSVILILGPDCPISQKYIPTIKALHQLFGAKVNFIGIFPGYFTAAEVTSFAEEYGLTFDWYVDHNMSAISALHATVTPEAFLLAPDLQRQYSGAIDNWFYDLGKYRQKATEAYLKEAIESVLAGTPVKTNETKAIGCVIQQGHHSDGHDHNH